jgi:endothelin-converting enzyme/putative endopeptidase
LSKLICTVVIALVGLPVYAQTASSSDDVKLEHFDPKLVDSSADPCTDFYKYACGKIIANSPVPPDEIYWGPFGKIAKWNDNVLHQALDEAAAKKDGRSANEQKVGDYYTACMDESKIESESIKPVQSLLDQINGMKSTADLAPVLAQLHLSFPASWQGGDNQTNVALLGFGPTPDYNDARQVVAGIDQGGLGLPSRDFYLKDDAKSKQIRDQYLSLVTNMLQMSGEQQAQAQSDAQKIVALETAMAKPQMDNVARRDPKNLNNRMTLAQVKALTPSFNWDAYLSAVGAPSSNVYLVTTPAFFRALDPLIKQTPLDTWKAYLRWHTVRKAAPYLSKPFVEAEFNFYDKALFGAQQLPPRWRRCANSADRDLGEALGQAYVAKAFPPESKERMVKLVNDIEAALDRDITTIDWMQASTKEAAHKKLAAVLDKIGYPDHWRDYSALNIAPESYVENVMRSTAFESKRQMNKINKPLDRYEWGMTPPTVNAYEDPQTNTINFPAGILQPPFFDATMPDVVNYAAIGAVIGHETIHGFDDQGRKFDANGNLHDWWTAADNKAYDQRGDCIANEYTQMVPEAGVKQNGRLTQGEDTADNGGIHLAYSAVEKGLKEKGENWDTKGPDGLSNLQRFFLGYANVWCGEFRPEAMRTLVLTNPHSLDKYRVNNVVSNMPEFQQAFSCKAGQPMVHANKCRVW